jgi:uncharacterized protein YndB with AHSA1/START domain
MNQTIYNPDLKANKLFVERSFDAPVEKLWKCWTEPDLLDQWWAPKPWKAVTQSIDFREGGTWFYYMQGPEGERHYCRADYKTIVPQRSYTGLDAFCDENGKVNEEFPRMTWKVDFHAAKSGTKVDVEISFPSRQDMDKIIEMGFKEGFSMAHDNLDELLKKSN